VTARGRRSQIFGFFGCFGFFGSLRCLSRLPMASSGVDSAHYAPIVDRAAIAT
jgi:hypothetical protein